MPVTLLTDVATFELVRFWPSKMKVKRWPENDSSLRTCMFMNTTFGACTLPSRGTTGTLNDDV